MRAAMMTVVVCLATGCTSRSADLVVPDTSAETFAGVWQSVTPSYEFVSLTVVSKSSEMGVLGARLTLSGVAWDGEGRIDRDSLVLGMVMSGTTQPSGTIVARARDARTLQIQLRTASANPLGLTLVRQ